MGIAAPEQQNLPDPRPMSEAHGEASARCVGWYGKAGDNKVAQPTMEESKKLQSETITKLRILSHDLSNYIETIMQASYLLAQAKLDENNKKWLDLVDKAAQDESPCNLVCRLLLETKIKKTGVELS